jgi:hypothetical protein
LIVVVLVDIGYTVSTMSIGFGHERKEEYREHG